MVIEPDRSKARSVIKIEQIRALGPQVAFKPYMGRRRVIIIDEAETMMVEGANALLKTLEEPSGETLFVLVTAAVSALLPTILSRCQLLRFAPLTRQTIRHFLEGRGVESGRATVIAGYADGSIARALELTEEGAIEARRRLVERITEARSVGPIEVIKLASDLSREGQVNLKVLLDGLLVFYRDVALVSAGASRDRVVNSDLLTEIEAMASDLTTEDVLSHIEQVASAQGDLQSYVDVKLLLERLLFDAATSPSLGH
jgi:DNA polymerase-3 subunit delta'